MSTEVASRIRRVRRSLHDRRKKGREREKHERKNVPYPLFSIPFFSFLLFPYPPSPPPPLFDTCHTGYARYWSLAHVFAGFFLSRNKTPARQVIKLTLRIRSTKMRRLEIARDSESLFFLITSWDCSGGVASLLQSAINRFCRSPAQTHSISLNGMLLFLVFFSFRHATHHG